MKKSILGMLILMLVLIIVSGCLTEKRVEEKKEPAKLETGTYISPDLETVEATQELRKFESKKELAEFLQKTQAARYGFDSFFALGGAQRSQTIAESLPVSAVATKETAADSRTTGTEYSTTNVQVEGVDEADFIKNDEKYIYMIADNKLIIVNAFPAEEGKILSETKIDGSASKIFLNENKVIVFSEKQEQDFTFRKNEFFPMPKYTMKTYVFIYDVSDKEKPELLKDYSVTGYLFEARMIDDVVYFVAQDYAYYEPPIIYTPIIREGTKTVLEPEIFYFDNPENNYNYNTIVSLDLTEDKINAKTFMLGNGNTLYMSQENLYISYRKERQWRFGFFYEDENAKEKFNSIVLPLLPEEYRERIQEIKKENLSEAEEWNKISEELYSMWSTALEDKEFEKELEAIAKEIQEKINEFDLKKAQEFDRTVIQKFSVREGEIEFKGTGEVPGSLLNQFSLDESQGNLRVATTTSIWARELVQYNNVFVLDEEMKTIGSLKEIAKDERIYSTRFIGNKLYMVTFRQVDPFFVIGLEDPTNPKVLGYLKIPGFSNYLHPFDENHIIGVGKETKESEFGGVTTLGVKIALFDVSDVSNPKQVDKVEIGGRETNSEILNDHKAFLFDKRNNLLVIPINEREEKESKESAFFPEYGSRVWRGAYIFNLSEKGFTKKGTVQHSNALEEYYYWLSGSSVLRSLYIDNVLYTVSGKFIKMNSLNDLKELNEVKLPYSENIPYYYH